MKKLFNIFLISSLFAILLQFLYLKTSEKTYNDISIDDEYEEDKEMQNNIIELLDALDE